MDCEDELLFHQATLFRGFHRVWQNFSTHNLCDYRTKMTNGMHCLLCLIRSFTLRINDMRLNTSKSLKPLEIFSEMKHVRDSLNNPNESLEKEFFELLKLMSESHDDKVFGNFVLHSSTCKRYCSVNSFIECEGVIENQRMDS